MDKNKFIEEINKINININSHIEKQLKIYYEFLLEYNEHTNLTRIISEEDVYLKHYYDSLTILKIVDIKKIKSILDIGTGAGFPGVVLKIFNPHLELTLLDSNKKKTIFLEELIKKLELDNVSVINDRSEKYIENKREQFDLVTSRAVADLKILSELSLPYVKLNGYFIPLKADSKEELDKSNYAINILGGEIIESQNFLLPIENSKRMLIKIKKIKKTPIKYPRTYDKILKKPLKIY
ncbi:MAG: 16S rRNA (guanine(527)-N(7))-methyltransferase RsmG [Bacilli bacterium]|nr:16S rRNA (guanine(527)-N(7))-methyltransferase RsmG [Bacilli bacterium]